MSASRPLGGIARADAESRAAIRPAPSGSGAVRGRSTSRAPWTAAPTEPRCAELADPGRCPVRAGDVRRRAASRRAGGHDRAGAGRAHMRARPDGQPLRTSARSIHRWRIAPGTVDPRPRRRIANEGDDWEFVRARRDGVAALARGRVAPARPTRADAAIGSRRAIDASARHPAGSPRPGPTAAGRSRPAIEESGSGVDARATYFKVGRRAGADRVGLRGEASCAGGRWRAPKRGRHALSRRSSPIASATCGRAPGKLCDRLSRRHDPRARRCSSGPREALPRAQDAP